MEIYNDIKEKTEDILDDLTNHLEARWRLGVLNSMEKVAETISVAASVLILGAIAAFILLFMSLGIAWLIGQSLNNLAWGLFIVGGLYIIIGVIVYNQRENIIKIPVINSFIQKLNYED